MLVMETVGMWIIDLCVFIIGHKPNYFGVGMAEIWTDYFNVINKKH